MTAEATFILNPTRRYYFANTANPVARNTLCVIKPKIRVLKGAKPWKIQA
jgi:hypothetical protein